MSLSGAVLQQTYQVGELLGTGGMGDVYEASHARLNRRFAIKILNSKMAKNDEAFARFRREAQIASELGHPHIVSVVDFNTLDDGTPYIVMERLVGEDLDDRLRRIGSPLPTSRVLHVARQLGSALSAAHAKGVVHRDLKPQNIFVTPVDDDDWYVKILDFGISKIRGATSIITQDNFVIGTPNYMSPEQAEGRSDAIDHRTDQFALAAILYQMVTGRIAFDDERIPSILYKVVHTQPTAIEELVSGVPPGFREALSRGLAKDPNDRFASVKTFVKALHGRGSQRLTPVPQSLAPTVQANPRSVPESTLATAPTLTVPLPRSHRRALVVLASGAAIAAAVAALILAGGDDPGADRVPPAGQPAAAEVPSEDRQPSESEPTIVSLPDAASVAEPAQEVVTVRFDVQPSAAEIVVDGQRIDGGRVVLPKDGVEHTAIVRRSGYNQETRTFEASSDQTFEIRLERQSRRPRAPPRRNTTTKKKKKEKQEFILEL